MWLPVMGDLQAGFSLGRPMFCTAPQWHLAACFGVCSFGGGRQAAFLCPCACVRVSSCPQPAGRGRWALTGYLCHPRPQWVDGVPVVFLSWP